MQRTSFKKPRLRTLTPLLAVAGLMVAQQAMAHGFSYDPPSRAFMCQKSPTSNHNDCGTSQANYQPQGLENHTYTNSAQFPTDTGSNTGPIDNVIASAADSQNPGYDAFAILNDQSSTRWQKTDVTAGETRSFRWAFTKPHPTREISYYITKNGWDQNAPLTRADFDPKPICSVSYNGTVPPARAPHSGEMTGDGAVSYTYADIPNCTIPADRSGYNVILGVWKVADPELNDFVSAIDINVKNGHPTPTPTWTKVGEINAGTTDLHTGDTVGTRVFDKSGKEVTSSLGTSITIANDTQGNHVQWPYLLAQQINTARSQYYMAGQKNGDDITPAPGISQQVYAKKGSSVGGIEIQFGHHGQPIIGENLQVTVNPDYPITGNSAVITPFVTLSKKANVTASVFKDNKPVGTQAAEVDNSGQDIPVTVANATAGNYKLVITAPGAKQQSFDVKLTGGGGKYPQWQPNGNYNNGDMVSNKGANYACKVAGWCNQAVYEPGGSYNGGTAWPSAWTKQ